MKTDDKIKTLGPQLLMAYSGKPAQHPSVYQIRNLYALGPSAAASWICRALTTSLRTRKAYFGTMTEVPFAAHGYGAYYFPMSLLDWYHDPEAPLEKGLATLRRCIDEVAKRLVIDPGKTGSRDVEL
ncbi:hypothetical protein K438DRAFT_1911102 [Mycena galopus ATCC 62051]|nr:hypothetical protein K438DRAFT_1911102 [Mycena galopus ATCC 62051]